MNKISTLENRLTKNYKKLKKWLNKSSIEAFRLYEKDIPEFPYIIDVYKDYAVVYDRGKRLDENEDNKLMIEQNHQAISTSIRNLLNIDEKNIIFKTRTKIDRSKEQYEKVSDKNQKIIVNEEDLKFYVNLYDYLDTGLFLDHRWLRRKIKTEAKLKRCLNLYCYTGSITCALLKAAPEWVDSVDLSNTYLNWAQENIKLNFPENDNYAVIRDDVFAFLKEDHDYYDLIICDPPSFSNSKKLTSEFDIQRDHIGLINLCMKNLDRSGKLYFSTNKRKFKLAPEITEKYHIKDISQKSFDQDFHDIKARALYEITFISK
jgi:23S rRNA (cytosine1962-C5)-methyltransferase